MRIACLLGAVGLSLMACPSFAESDVLIVTADIAQCGTVEDIEYACESDLRCCPLKEELDPSEYEDEPEDEVGSSQTAPVDVEKTDSFRIVQKQQYLLEMPDFRDNVVLPDDLDLLLQ